MNRRPLGASLPAELRLVAYEQRLRDHHAAIQAVEDALQVFEVGIGADGRKVSAGVAWARFRRAVVDLQELKNRPIGRKPGPKPPPETVPST